MTTQLHVLFFYLAGYQKRNLNESSSFEARDEFKKYLHKEIPWLLLPDAIRTYTGSRRISHFEKVPEGHGKDCSWITFPCEDVLAKLTKQNTPEMVSFELKDGYPDCVIGEETIIGEFDIRNGAHKHYEALRCHLVQDMCFDECLRCRLINPEQRFSDKFSILHNEETITGEDLRAQIALFQKLAFIKFVGNVYEKTGVLLNKEWFDKYVLTALNDAYPTELATNTYAYMDISDELNERINAHMFELTAEEKESLIISDNLDRLLDELYAYAIRTTKFEV